MRILRADGRLLLLLVCFFLSGPLLAQEKIRLQLNWLHQFEFAGFYAALEKGYYRDAGLDVSLIEGGPRVDTVQEVMNSRADVGVGSSSVLLARQKHPDLTVLGVIYQHSPAVILSLRGKGIQKLADLRGKRLMDSPNAGDVMAMLQRSGIDEKTLERVEHDGSPSWLVAGQADAMISYSTNEPYVLEEMGVPYVLFSPRRVGIDFYGDNFFTTKQLIEAKPEAVRKFREASLLGWKYALAHKAELADLILNKYSRAKSREALLFEAEETEQLIKADLVDLGYQSQVRWESIAKTYADLGLLPVNHALNGLIYDPEPSTDTTRLWLAMGGFAAISLILLFISLGFGRLNLRFRQEILERKLAQEALEESQGRFQSLFEMIPDALVVVNSSGCIIQVNKAFELLFAYLPEDILGKSISVLMPQRFQTAHDAFFFRFVSNPCEMAMQGRRLWAVNAQGLEFPVEIGVGHMSSGEEKVFICTIRDTTARCQAEDELLQHRDHLQEMIKLQTADLRRAKEIAEAANSAKDTFLTNISHELRTPMHGILSMAKIGLRKTAGEPVLSKWHNMFSHILGSGERMQLLVDDLLEISNSYTKIDNYKLAPTDLRLLCAKAVERMTPTASKKRISIVLEGIASAPLVCDGSRIGRVLRQLIDNALKFSPADQVVEVCLEEISEQSVWRVSVSDRGPGIPEDELQSIFESFVQGSHTSTGAGGKGLGLTLCRQVINHHGGTIQAINREGGGAVLCFDIPQAIALPECTTA